jgi:hypothetical protein
MAKDAQAVVEGDLTFLAGGGDGGEPLQGIGLVQLNAQALG